MCPAALCPCACPTTSSRWVLPLGLLSALCPAHTCRQFRILNHALPDNPREAQLIITCAPRPESFCVCLPVPDCCSRYYARCAPAPAQGQSTVETVSTLNRCLAFSQLGWHYVAGGLADAATVCRCCHRCLVQGQRTRWLRQVVRAALAAACTPRQNHPVSPAVMQCCSIRTACCLLACRGLRPHTIKLHCTLALLECVAVLAQKRRPYVRLAQALAEPA